MQEVVRTPSPWLVGWFRWYVRRYLRRSFHVVGVGGPSPVVPADAPLVVYVNHASWWDPLLAVFLCENLTPGRSLYAPFDASALARYPIFERLGFFGVDQSSRRGAAQFLKTARGVLAQPGASLWMTPEGRFVDPRNRDAEFRPGLAHLAEDLARSAPETRFVPLALEYVFWEERLPESLVWCGEVVRAGDHVGLDKEAWDGLLSSRLRGAQASLAERSIAHDAAAFRVLAGGSAGVGGGYECLRWLHAKLTGKAYRAAHGEKF